MDEETLAVLAQQDMMTLAQWYCDLNGWEWPEDLPNPESPDDFKHWPERGRRSIIMDWINEAIGPRIISRVHNKGMNDEEFEDFWRGCNEGNNAAFERYWRRLQSKVAARLSR